MMLLNKNIHEVLDSLEREPKLDDFIKERITHKKQVKIIDAIKGQIDIIFFSKNYVVPKSK
jgi:hypothetical protein